MKAHLKVNATNIGSVLLGLIISFFPKCPFCWPAYLSIFSSLELASIPYQPWLRPMMMALFFVNTFSLFVIARKRKNYTSFSLNVTGAILIMVSISIITSALLTYIGLLMIITSSLWNLYAKKLVCKVEGLETFSG